MEILRRWLRVEVEASLLHDGIGGRVFPEEG